MERNNSQSLKLKKIKSIIKLARELTKYNEEFKLKEI